MQAIILCAGMGKRLGKLTEENTKCMVKVNGTTLIERSLSCLNKYNLNKIILVVGYKAQNLKQFVSSLHLNTKIEFVDNVDFATTNNIYSLYLAKNFFNDDTLLLESDIIFDSKMLDDLVYDFRPTLALVDSYAPWMDGTCVKIDKDSKIICAVSSKTFLTDKNPDYYKTINIYKFSKNFLQNSYLPALTQYIAENRKNEYYEKVLFEIANTKDCELRAKINDGKKWYEIDTESDLEIASNLFDNKN